MALSGGGVLRVAVDAVARVGASAVDAATVGYTRAQGHIGHALVDVHAAGQGLKVTRVTGE